VSDLDASMGDTVQFRDIPYVSSDGELSALHSVPAFERQMINDFGSAHRAQLRFTFHFHFKYINQM
jgi:hypothetical protein